MQHFRSAHVPEHLYEFASAEIERPAALTATVDLGRVWRDLRAGRLFASDTFCSDSRCFASVRTRFPPAPQPSAYFELLERILLGQAQKVIADEVEVAVSTLAGRASDCMRRISREHRTSRVPALFVLAAHAELCDVFVPARLTRSEDDTSDSFTVSIQRPDLWLARLLSPAEFAVARLMFEGKTHKEMARLRGTSLRTIANQIGAMFARLKVSGRSEFLAMIARSMLTQGQAS